MKINRIIVTAACSLITYLSVAQNTNDDTARIQKEEDFSRIITVPIPVDVALEVGGMTFMPNDELAVCTRRGEIWTISNPYMNNGYAPRYRLFADGLHEPLGLNYINGQLYTAQRSEVTKLKDTDGDGVADEYKTVVSWPLSGNYHEYAYGPIQDKQGNLYVTLNVAWAERGEESFARWHGWMMKIDTNENLVPFATGMRSPSSLNFNGDGDIFYAENQGSWVGSGFIGHVESGDFFGLPHGLNWANLPGSPVKLRRSDIYNFKEPKYEVSKKLPGLKNPAVWVPHGILGISTSAILNYDDKGEMGPFKGQLFVGDQGHSKIMRVALEKVKGVYQGVVFPFREGFSSGVLRTVWGSDGSMFVGMTSRGWGSTGTQPYGLQRLVWNGKTPFEMKTVNAKPDGFEIEFTQPVDKKRAANADSYELTSFTYYYWHEYGSPVINMGNCPIKAISVSDDGLKVRLVVDSLRLGYIHEIKAEGVRSADNFALLHNTGYYTLNQLPDGDKMAITAENRVEPKKTPMHHHAENKTAKGTEKKVTAAKNTAAKKTSTATEKRVTKQPADWTKGPDHSIQMTPAPNLKFNISNFTVKAGAKVKLTFNNTDDMLHNVVITVPNAADDVGSAALNLGLNGERMHFVPNSPKVLFHTALLQPHKAESIYFTAPDKPGDYPFVCTYPGHYIVMRGIMKVIAK